MKYADVMTCHEAIEYLQGVASLKAGKTTAVGTGR
jgi:hypothetical protein